MKSLITLALSLCLPHSASAQDTRLPQKLAQGYAKACVEQVTIANPQLTMKANPALPCAEQGEGGGAMLIPAKELSAKLFASAKAGTIIPVGQIWLRKWILAVDGKALAKEKQRLVRPVLDEKERPMSLYLLGARKTTKGKWELLIYGTETKPVQILPLKSVEYVQKLPVEIQWERGEKATDKLVLTLFGRQETVVEITK